MKREQATKYKETILIVDDMEINQEILTEMLKEDYNLIKAYDGQEAIDLLEKNHLEIQLILLDFIMPQKDGLEVLKEMKEEQWIKRIPSVVVVTVGGILWLLCIRCMNWEEQSIYTVRLTVMWYSSALKIH